QNVTLAGHHGAHVVTPCCFDDLPQNIGWSAPFSTARRPARGFRLQQICKRPRRISQRDRINGDLSLDQAPHDGHVPLGVHAECVGDMWPGQLETDLAHTGTLAAYPLVRLCRPRSDTLNVEIELLRPE